MTSAEKDHAPRGSSWALAAGLLAAVALLVLLIQRLSGTMTSGTLATAATLLVGGGALAGVFLRRAGIAVALFDARGWRWLDPGAVLYLVVALASFVVMFIVVDARGMSPIVRELAALINIAVPAATPWAVAPRAGVR